MEFYVKFVSYIFIGINAYYIYMHIYDMIQWDFKTRDSHFSFTNIMRIIKVIWNVIYNHVKT